MKSLRERELSSAVMAWDPPKVTPEPASSSRAVQIARRKVVGLPIYAWALIAVLVPAMVVGMVVSSDSGPSRRPDTLSGAFCTDLDNGYSLMNLWPRDQDPKDYASDAWGMIAISCPEHYDRNVAYFEQWNLPPP